MASRKESGQGEMLAASATITANVGQVHVLPLPFQARVCREAGATVRFNTMLRDMNINVSANDQRFIEVLASDSHCTMVPR